MTRLIKERFPQVKVLILTTFGDNQSVTQALQNGADGYVLKIAKPDELIISIKSAALGLSIMHKAVLTTVTKQIETVQKPVTLEIENRQLHFTSREMAFIRYVVDGRSNKEIAAALHLAEGSVKNIMSALLEKIGVSDRTQLAVFAIKNHLV